MDLALPFILVFAGAMFLYIYTPDEEPSYDVIDDSEV